MEIIFPTGIQVSSMTLDYHETVAISYSRTGKAFFDKRNVGGAAGAGFVFGRINFQAGSVDQDPRAVEKVKIDNFLKQMSGGKASFPWARLPFNYTKKATPSGVTEYSVTDQTANTAGDLVTTINAAWADLEAGMWVNVLSQPKKACYVLAKVSDTQFVFSPQHVLPDGLKITACSEILIRKTVWNRVADPKVLQSRDEVSPVIPFDFQEVTQEVSA